MPRALTRCASNTVQYEKKGWANVSIMQDNASSKKKKGSSPEKCRLIKKR